MTYRNFKLCTISLGLGAGMLAVSSGTWAAGFALLEQNVSGLGNAYAGQAASAQDASTIFFNPAGMTLLPDRQVVLSTNGIKPSATFSNTASTAATGRGLVTPNGGDAGDWALVPALYAAFAITSDLRVGIGVNAPFGLKTEYDTPWTGQYQAIKSELDTININPSIAYRVNSVVSLGAGVNWQRAKAELSQAVIFNPALANGSAKVEGDSDAWGYNLGALFQLGDDMRIGVAYRSHIKQDLEGTVSFARPFPVPNAGAARDGPVSASLDLPDTASVSVFQRFGDKWDLMGDITWTHWSRFKDLTVVRGDGAHEVLETQVENWDDTWRISLGLNYHASQQLTLRFGTSYDQSPVPDANRTARIPDNDRLWGAIGLQYAFTPGLLLDVGYAHLFVRKSSINQPNPVSAGGSLVGNYDNSVDIVGVQLTWSF